MSDDTTIVVKTLSNGGTVEIQIEGIEYILGIYNRAGDPVPDVLMTDYEMRELLLKIQIEVDEIDKTVKKSMPRSKKKHKSKAS